MSNTVLKETALENLREFQEMSYADVSALILQRRFEEARTKYKSVYQSLECHLFDAAINLEITASHDDILEAMSGLAANMQEPEKLAAIGFDLSWNALYENEGVICDQGIEINLYSSDTYDFTGASEAELLEQCHSLETVWQGTFVEMTTMPLSGLGALARQFYDFALEQQDDPQHVIQTRAGNWIVNPNYIARHVAKLLMAIAYHEYMAGFAAQVDVPATMIFIIGEHDEIEVPVTFYRVEPNMIVAAHTGEETSEAPVVEDVQPEMQSAPLHAPEHESMEMPQVFEQETVLDEAQTPPLYAEPEIDSEPEIHAEPEMHEAPLPDATPGLGEPVLSDVMPHHEFGSVDAKANLGLPIKPKTFGQRIAKPEVGEIPPEFDTLAKQS